MLAILIGRPLVNICTILATLNQHMYTFGTHVELEFVVVVVENFASFVVSTISYYMLIVTYNTLILYSKESLV